MEEVTKEVKPNKEVETECFDKLAADVHSLNLEDECNDSDSNSDKCFSEIPDEEPSQNLTEEEMEINYKEALKLKLQGNNEFKEEKFLESASTYTNALRICPLKYAEDRSILYGNRAAAKAKLGRNESAVEDCTKAIELNEKYLKVYLRRAKLHEDILKLDESLSDYKKILELDPKQKDALEAQIRLPPKINERNEALKTEMFGKMKDLGNLILRPFGLSTDNFQVNQDPSTGSYSLNFQQNPS